MIVHRFIKTLTLILIAAKSGLASAQTFDLSWYTIDGGPGPPGFSAGGELELSGTIGQPDAGAMSGGDFELIGGFWAAATATVVGDCNQDGGIDLSDYTCFSDCLTGPVATPSPECLGFDFDADNDIDVHDFAYFQRIFGS